jgi:carotenoid cleavage dioxygenase-like enzyme
VAISLSFTGSPIHPPSRCSHQVRVTANGDLETVMHPKLDDFTADGRKSPDVEIPVDAPTMMWDFAVTEDHTNISDQQIVFKVQEMVLGCSSTVYDRDKTASSPSPRFC